jgi:ribosomal protein S18 acetylase RimI-like enzyme
MELVVVDGEPAGVWQVVDEPPEPLYLARVALLPAFQGRGIGSLLVRELQERGAREGRAVTLSVFEINPARRLYERLGFRVTERQPPKLELRWEAVPGDLAYAAAQPSAR